MSHNVIARHHHTDIADALANPPMPMVFALAFFTSTPQKVLDGLRDAADAITAYIAARGQHRLNDPSDTYSGTYITAADEDRDATIEVGEFITLAEDTDSAEYPWALTFPDDTPSAVLNGIHDAMARVEQVLVDQVEDVHTGYLDSLAAAPAPTGITAYAAAAA